MADKSIKTAGNWLVIVPKDGPNGVIDGHRRVPKGASRLAGFAVSDDAYLFLNALERRVKESKEASIREQARDDGVEMASHFSDEIIEKLVEEGEASDDANNDYSGGDSYHHESHVDRSYDVREACTVIAELDEYEETDRGLWEGVDDFRRMAEIIAAYTYGAAVYHVWTEVIKGINEEYEGTIADDIDRVDELRGKTRDEDEQNELNDLTAGADWTTDEGFNDWKKTKIKTMVEAFIKEAATDYKFLP